VEVKFIGTSSGQASLKRHHSSLLLSSEDYSLLIDAGDGISKALLFQEVHLNSINSVLFSHFHPDHYSGFASLIVQMKQKKREKPLTVFIHHSLKERLPNFLDNSYLFPERFGFEFNIVKFNYDESVDIANGIKFIAKENTHLHDLKNEKDNFSFSCSSFLFALKDKNIFYTADIGNTEDLYLFKDNKIDIMISETTHAAIEDIFTAYKKLGSNSLYLTHISSNDEGMLLNFIENIPEKEVDKIFLAMDGMTLQI
jgi:ribonuclease BN (tRNA processing enzyme)